jgi:hypothetical protein
MLIINPMVLRATVVMTKFQALHLAGYRAGTHNQITTKVSVTKILKENGGVSIV